ncbi:hypothetical protein Tco_1522749 [Tanacetum coccineum]
MQRGGGGGDVARFHRTPLKINKALEKTMCMSPKERVTLTKNGSSKSSHGAFNFDDADDVDKVPETELDDPLEQNENPSEDPFGIYSILNKNKDNDANIPVSDHSIKFPPGFTPNGVSMQEDIGRSVNDVTSPRIVEKEHNEQERSNNNNGFKRMRCRAQCVWVSLKNQVDTSAIRGSILCVLRNM